MNNKQLSQLTQYIESADVALQQARDILAELGGDKASEKLAKAKAKNLVSAEGESGEKKIIEGVFNGQNMIGPDGKEYSVPANYASKSKLVEGDILKLTIQPDGSFLYKQIHPVPRARVKGKLVMDEMTGQYAVFGEDGKKYNVLTASVTYFKGEPDDIATILIPKDKTCQWAAIENIIKDKSSEFSTGPQPFSKLSSDIQDSGYSGISTHAKAESILPDIDDIKEEPVSEKTQQERDKIEQMINSPDPEIDKLIDLKDAKENDDKNGNHDDNDDSKDDSKDNNDKDNTEDTELDDLDKKDLEDI